MRVVGDPEIRLSNWDLIGITEINIGGTPGNDSDVIVEFSPFPTPFPYFDFPESVRLEEGRNEFNAHGEIYRQEWWPNPHCVEDKFTRLFYMKPNDLCYAMVEELDKIPQPPNDPTNGFVINQRCVAKYSCGNRPQMKDKTWLTKVVPAFVQPFLDKTGKWNEVMQACAAQWNVLPNYVKAKKCEAQMAEYHIEQDLQKSLNENGCGTDADWSEVGSYIDECVAEQNSSIPAFFAKSIVAATRNKIRRLCHGSRSKS
jgi:hypothetical protein